MKTPQSFELKETHLKLLKNANWYFDNAEYGAPAIDPKRPFGNSGVESDILEILGMEDEVCPHCGEYLSEKSRQEAKKIYTELLTAIQIIFAMQDFKVGKYLKTNNGWAYIGGE